MKNHISVLVKKSCFIFLAVVFIFSSFDVMAMEEFPLDNQEEILEETPCIEEKEQEIRIICGQDYLIDSEILMKEEGSFTYSIVEEEGKPSYVSLKEEETEDGKKLFLHGDMVGEGAALKIQPFEEIQEVSAEETKTESEVLIPIIVVEETKAEDDIKEDEVTEEMQISESPEEEVESKELLPPSGLSLCMASNGIELKWKISENALGYYIYRKTDINAEWELICDAVSGTEVSYRDTKALNGQRYWYTMKAYNDETVSEFCKEAFYLKLNAPTITKWKRNSKSKMTLYWNKNIKASGYQIQYSRSSTFASSKTIVIANPSVTSRKITKLAKKKTYYARIRAYYTYNGKNYYSSWNATGNVKKAKKITLSSMKKKKKMIELRKLAGEGIGQFAISQGACTDGIYGYYLLTNNTINKCKLLKVKLSNFSKVKVSGILDVNHGNDITYDSHKKLLVVAHNNGGNGKKFSYIDPNTLTVVDSKKVEVPVKIAGGSLEDAKTVTGFGGIAYNASKRQYVAMISNVHHLLVMDENLNPVRMAKTAKNNNYWFQGIDTTDEYVLVCMSPKTKKQKYNIIMVYDWDGNYISTMNVKKNYEIENLFHVGNQYYVTFYHSYYKTVYKTVKKKVIVKGKTKTKKVKKKMKIFQRDNLVYKMSI